MSKIEEMLKNERVEWKKLGEIGEFYGGITGKKKDDFKDGNAKFITYKNVFSNQATKLDVVDRVRIDESENQRTLLYGDIIFTGSSETPNECGMSSVITEKLDEKVYLNSFCFFLRLNSGNTLLPDFAKHLFRSEIIRNKIGKTASGVTRFNISKELMKKIVIPIPSIKTQEKIVKTLDKFTEYVTELQAELQYRTNQYEYYRNMLLSEEYLNKLSKKLLDVSGGENRLYCSNPKYMRELVEVKLETIVKIKNGKDWKKLGKGNIPVYGSGGNMDIYVDKYSYNKPSVLIPRKGSIENVFYLEEPFWNVDTIFYTEIDESKIIPRYLYYFISNYDIKLLSTDSTRPSLTQEALNRIVVQLPPLSLQNKIVEILDKFQAMLSETKGLLPKEIEERQKQYEYYREKLLTFDVESGTHARTQLIANSYFIILKEAANVIGVNLYSIEWKTLGDIGRFENGSGMPKTMFKDDGEVGAIHYGHIYTKYNMFIDKTVVSISTKDAEKLKKVNKGDLVIARTSENIDDVMKTVAYLGEKTVVAGGHSTIFRHKENPKYLSYVLNGADYAIKQKNKMARGVKVIELSTVDMEKIKIPLPPLPVQEYIVSILDKFDILVNDIKSGLPKEIEERKKQYEYYRERLLSFKKS